MRTSADGGNRRNFNMLGRVFQSSKILLNIGGGCGESGRRRGRKCEDGKQKSPRAGAFMEAKRLPPTGLAWWRTLELGVCV